MKSKKHDEESGHENSERWLLTYSDLITLLLALFIILYSISQIDAKKYQQVSEAMNQAFNNDTSVTSGGQDTGIKEGTTTTKKSNNSNAKKPLDKVYNELNAYIQKNNLQDQIQLENTDTYVLVRLKDAMLFVPDKSVMLDSSKPILLEIEKAVANVYVDIDHITISGHTADPDNTQGDYSSEFAWQLSADRAYTVLQYFIDNGLPQTKLSIEGCSRFNPIADNTTPEGRAKNRRVEIMIIKNADATTTSVSTTAAKK